MSDSHRRALTALDRRGRLRGLKPRAGLDFSSNDYLGLAASPELADAFAEAIARGVPAGAGGSRLLRGNHPEHEALEAEAAEFFGAEAALFFGGGFIANTAIFTTLPQRGDLVVNDELIHASVHDGLRAGKAAFRPARHNDSQSFEDVIAAWRAEGGKGRPWIAVESLYSMDGDQAPLDALIEVTDRHDGVLVIDEAHATGVFGDRGRGLGAVFEGRHNVISLHTCGKALGVMGALVLAPAVMRDFLVNRSRAFIYATAPSPLIAAGVRAALRISAGQPDRRERLHALIAHAGRAFASACEVVPTGSQIQPVVVWQDTKALALAEALQRRRFDVRAVRPPTVPEGTSRLRISVTLNVTDAQVSAMAAALGEEMARLGR